MQTPQLKSLLAAAAVLTVVAPSHAATWTGSTDGSWANGANWTGVAPDNLTAQTIDFGTGSVAQAIQELNGSYLLTSITNGSTSAVTINGGTGSNTLTFGTTGVTTLNASGADLTLGPGYTIAFGSGVTATTFTAASGKVLAVDANLNLTNAGGTGVGLTISGSGTINIGGAISGSGNINIASNGSVNFTGDNSQSGYSGNISAANTTGGSFTVATGAKLVTTGNFTASRNKTYTIDGLLSVGTFVMSTNASTTLGGAGTVNFNQFTNQNSSNTTISVANFNIGAGGIVRTNGTITLGATTVGSLANWSSSAALGLTNGVTTKFDTTGGDITLTGSIGNNASGVLEKRGSGTLTLSGTNTYTGGTTINNGTLVAAAAAALGTGAVQANGGTLATSVANVNTGAFNLAGGTLVLNGAGAGTITLSPGQDFNFTAGIWRIDLASGLDKIIGGGTGSDFVISGGLIDLGGGAIDYTQTYSLIAGFETINISGVGVTGYDTANWQASINNNGELSFTAVPEPATYGLLGAGALAAASMVRRRRRKAAAKAAE